MRTRTAIFTLIAVLGAVAGSVAAAPSNQKPSDTSTSRDSEDVHVTVTAGRGRLGFTALQISPDLRKHLGAPSDRGVLVDRVRPDSPAARAGLQVGDVVLEVDSEATRSAGDVLDAISDHEKGDVVPLVVVRGKGRVTLQATLEDDPGPSWRGSGELDGKTWKHSGTHDSPFDMKQWFGDKDTRRALEDTRKRLDELERRLDKLEHH